MKSRAKTPAAYIRSLKEPRKSEIKKLHSLIRKTVPRMRPKMTAGVIGYGNYHYKYASGREGDWPILALAAQKKYISLYSCASDGKKYVAEKYKKKLPKANIGRSCIRFRKIEDVDLNVIKRVLTETERLAKKM